jgi:hypothetical protein
LLIREIDADRQVHQRSGTVEGGTGGVVAGTGEWNDRKAAMGNLTGMKELEYGVPQDPTGDRRPGRRDPGRRIALDPECAGESPPDGSFELLLQKVVEGTSEHQSGLHDAAGRPFTCRTAVSGTAGIAKVPVMVRAGRNAQRIT